MITQNLLRQAFCNIKDRVRMLGDTSANISIEWYGELLMVSCS